MKAAFVHTFLLKSAVLPAIGIVLFFLFANNSLAQLSPGDLSEVHAHLEGMSNCTQCHTLGKKVANEKCLSCHTALKKQIDQNKGYHVSTDIAGKTCISCHSDHHGRKFKMIRFDKDNFKHNLTGYELLGAHTKPVCKDCHKADFIKDKEIRKNKNTFLGLNSKCLSCHTDYHQNTLSTDCKSCHDFEHFKPASKFKHDNTDFHLDGKHQDVKCSLCHKITTLNTKKFQEFSGLKFASCTSCHTDVHKNKFGQNCTKCHSEQSFHVIKSMSSFNHDNTNFRLENRHKDVDCKKCHKTKFTDHLSHNRCTDCHDDYHKGQFIKQETNPDCSDCHSTKGFSATSFTIERHNKSDFHLEGAHLATPCFVCHKKEESWEFRKIGINCVDCHDDIHRSLIDKKYYPESDCKSCHSVNQWAEIRFDHSKTDYKLLGKHKNQSCRDCHFKTDVNGKQTQRFKELTPTCTDCHQDKHHKQFEKNGRTDCFQCHDFNNWKAEKFDHNNTLFPLDGKHKNVACSGCHKNKQEEQTTFVVYKIKEFKCENCHL